MGNAAREPAYSFHLSGADVIALAINRRPFSRVASSWGWIGLGVLWIAPWSRMQEERDQRVPIPIVPAQS
jgi:hypothetical protein